MEIMSRANFICWVLIKKKAENGDKQAQEKIDNWSVNYLLNGLPTIEEQIEQAMPKYQDLYKMMQEKNLI